MKTQLARLRIWAHYRCSTEFCKGLVSGVDIDGYGDRVSVILRVYPRSSTHPVGMCGAMVWSLEASELGRSWMIIRGQEDRCSLR